MFRRDQKKAMIALFRIGSKAQERYGTKVFGPHSKNQIFELIEILPSLSFTASEAFTKRLIKTCCI